jgi:hypothetical protein
MNHNYCLILNILALDKRGHALSRCLRKCVGRKAVTLLIAAQFGSHNLEAVASQNIDIEFALHEFASRQSYPEEL